VFDGRFALARHQQQSLLAILAATMVAGAIALAAVGPLRAVTESDTPIPVQLVDTSEPDSPSDNAAKAGAATDDVQARSLETPTTGAEEPSLTEGTPPPTRSPATTAPPSGPETSSSEPPATEPPVTEPPATEPPTTDPPATDPPVTEPPVTLPPVTSPTVTEPPVTEPPTTKPRVTQPTITVTILPPPDPDGDDD